MGSHVGNDDEMTVLVTGFGPFREQYPVNPSYEIAKSLPAYLPALAAPPSKAGADTAPLPIPETRILVHPEPIRVNYQRVRALVPSLWDEPMPGEAGGEGEEAAWHGRTIDAAVHIGMAGPRQVYQVERRAHRRGYRRADVDGETLAEDEDAEDWRWRDYPDELETNIDVDDVLKRWKGHSPKHLNLRISEDAGRYLCDFIYYSSLSHLWARGRPRKVVFLHVPADASEKAVARGTALAVSLIRSIVESETLSRAGERGKAQDARVAREFAA
ncbi:hypothetical protein N3K66_002489 [Trichothecium roseum]|uniref:Uncharacterized protein n=1 Tax=Trichothecium roseum TaxID=47278 RepID=A0ACC0V9R2_9HYPO|nr:hypothetical protein N3K66_002489 [Trichothecium roseum]